ncbi:tRNA (adenosine(37)-N6)-threonylcarbamoyltransferase complex dimerization subunit type 1 TsaB [Pseudidiomarina taiwanensis]|uniref:tRNA threonylcarbamoyladenosine biosynthesis protein TsaB n=1 Tax=Pseudidiomarina taiwanensis TaxID=337250 RepID=A0A432ZNW4_9GAMM|nr:tRNA (adenosine(37)-N6)-threonylcarbamoyltransferase complex dimerization subunit type 1 TsaB [Pseudidiomarina taiwanensis]RUO79577.1 tRNA (adenosine(37)-N6)-threonylcarbamoyltransferase complex dimerization subunit type 1 TsaB [Pseudidiomarina taiwanensis]
MASSAEPIILALDTSTEMCSVALQVGNQIAERAILAPREHSQKILPFVEELLAEFDVTLAAVQRIIVGHGPGSFTGVRIGVSVAQGLAYSHDIPLTPVTTLAALAQQAMRLEQAQAVVAAIDARMGEVYIARYQNRAGLAECTIEPQMAALAELNAQTWWPDATVGCGTGWRDYSEILAPNGGIKVLSEVEFPLARDMLQLGQAEHAVVLTAAQLEPLYVRNEVTWKKLPGRE